MKKIFATILCFALVFAFAGGALAYTSVGDPVSINTRSFLDSRHRYKPESTNGRLYVHYNVKTYYNLDDTEPVTDVPQTFKIAARLSSQTSDVVIVSAGSATTWNSARTLQSLNTSTYYGIRFYNKTGSRYIKGPGSVDSNGYN